MEDKLRDYIERLFASAPKTSQVYELKEEIIGNTIERYHDLIAQGKTSGDAYNQAIAGIGDINELIGELCKGELPASPECTPEQMENARTRNSVFKGIAVALYILCVVPPILTETNDAFLNSLGPALMFVFISVATGLLIYNRKTRYISTVTDKTETVKIKRNALLKASAVGMYISCVVPCILIGDLGVLGGCIGTSLMFCMIAAATFMIVFSNRNNNTYVKKNDTMVENFKQWNSRKIKHTALYRALVAVLWTAASIVYIIITVATLAVTVTWIIFPAAAALQNLMRAVFEYSEASE